jgi:hypothetical protein
LDVEKAFANENKNKTQTLTFCVAPSAALRTNVALQPEPA